VERGRGAGGLDDRQRHLPHTCGASPASSTDVPLFLLAWVVGAAVVLCGALTYSELAAAFPRSGGVYVFVRESFGPLPAFLFTWAELIVIRPGAYGAIGITASAYTLRTLGQDPAASWRMSGAAVDQRRTTARRGVHRDRRHRQLLRHSPRGPAPEREHGIESRGAGAADPRRPHARAEGSAVPHMMAQRAHVGLSAVFLLAMVAISLAYDGWADLAFVGGEVQQPQKTLPRALLIGTATVVVLYLGANLVYLHLIPIQDMKHAELVAG